MRNNRLFMATEIELLKNISDRLGQLLVLTRLANAKAIADFKEEIKKDPVFQAILDLADGSLASSQMNEKVQEKTKVSERTVKGRIAQLLEKGALNSIRKGKEVYYEKSGLYD